MEMTIGTIGVAALLTLVLQVDFNLASTIPDKWKSFIAMGTGIVLGIAAMFYNVADITVAIVIEYIVGGLMLGAAAVGLYEGERTVLKPRE